MASFHTRSAPKLSHKSGQKLRPLPIPKKTKAKVSIKGVAGFVLALVLALVLLQFKFMMSRGGNDKLPAVQKTSLRSGSGEKKPEDVGDDDEATSAQLKKNLGIDSNGVSAG